MTVLNFGGRNSTRMLCGPAAEKPGQRVWGREDKHVEGRKSREGAEDGVIICKCVCAQMQLDLK